MVTKKSLPGWMARVLYGIGTGQHVCLIKLYIKMFTEPYHSTSPSMHLKGAWAIHRLCEAVQILVEPTDIPQTGLGLFGESAMRRSAAQYESARRGQAGERGGEEMMTMMAMTTMMTRTTRREER